MESPFKDWSGSREVHVELPEDQRTNIVIVSIWNKGNGSGNAFWRRVKLAWRMLVSGTFGGDDAGLEPDEARRLAKAVNQMAEVAAFRKRAVETIVGEGD